MSTRSGLACYVPEKDKKAVMEDLKPVYHAVNEEQGYEKLLEFEQKWGQKYPLSCKAWLDNRVNLSAFFEYDAAMRKIIYMTNAVEGVHRQLRKVTKTKGAFLSEQVLLKLMYGSLRISAENGTCPCRTENGFLPALY